MKASPWLKIGALITILKLKLYSRYSPSPLGAMLYAFCHTWQRWFWSALELISAVANMVPTRPVRFYTEQGNLVSFEEYNELVKKQGNVPTPAEKYQRIDGSGNCIEYPWLGQGYRTYGRVTTTQVPETVKLPDPAEVFERIMKRDYTIVAPRGQNCLQLYFAITVIHDFFRSDYGRGADNTDKLADNILRNLHSSYLDLQPLYGYNEEKNKSVRTFQGGKLKPDTIADDRLKMMKGSRAILILFNREHNYVCDQLAKLYPDQFKTDEELFYQARQIIIGVYHNIILSDYAGGITATYCADSSPLVSLPALRGFKRPLGFHTTEEFRILYQFHTLLPGSFDMVEQMSPTFDCETELRKILHEPCGAFHDRNVPALLKDFQIREMNYNRKWRMCSFNQFRRMLKLPPLKFEDFPEEIVDDLKELYESVDDIELVTGLIAEAPMNAGWGAPDTVGKAILADALQSISNDRFATVMYTPEVFTPWGYEHAYSTTMRDLFNRHTSLGPFPIGSCLTIIDAKTPTQATVEYGTGHQAGYKRLLWALPCLIYKLLVLPLLFVFYIAVAGLICPDIAFARSLRTRRLLRPAFGVKFGTKSKLEENKDVERNDSSSVPERVGPHFRYGPHPLVRFLAILVQILLGPVFFVWLWVSATALHKSAVSLKAVERYAKWKCSYWSKYKPSDKHGPGVFETAVGDFLAIVTRVLETPALQHMLNAPRLWDWTKLRKSMGGKHFVFRHHVVTGDYEETAQFLNSRAERRSDGSVGLRLLPALYGVIPGLVEDGAVHERSKRLVVGVFSHAEVSPRIANPSASLGDLLQEWSNSFPPRVRLTKKFLEAHSVKSLVLRSLLKCVYNVEVKGPAQTNLINKIARCYSGILLNCELDGLLLHSPTAQLLKLRTQLGELIYASASPALTKALQATCDEIGLSKDLSRAAPADLILSVAWPAITKLLTNALERIALDVAQAKLYVSNKRGFILEVIRMDPPIAAVSECLRVPKAVSVFGKSFELPAGRNYGYSLALANRDPTVFPKPATFDPTRDHTRVLGFAGFGEEGVRTCQDKDFELALIQAFLDKFVEVQKLA